MIILTNLGTSEYEPATYQWGVREKRKAQLFAAALHFWYPTARVKALVTEEAENKNGLLLLKSIPDVERIPISKGQSDEENWELFDTIVEAVPEGEEVLFDVTHGFRSLPIVTLLALSFEQEASLAALAERDAGDELAVFEELRRASE